MTPPVVRPFVAADALALAAPTPAPAGVGWAGLAASPAWTVLWGGQPAWAGGVVLYAPGVGEVWLVVGAEPARTAPRRLAREIRWGLREAARRVGCPTLTAHLPADLSTLERAFAAWLGFRAGGRCAFDAVGAHTTWRLDA